VPRKRDRMFLTTAVFAAVAGVGMLVVAAYGYHVGVLPPITLGDFFAWAGIAFLGAWANLIVYFQSGSKPKNPPRGGRKIAEVRVLEVRNARPPQVVEAERKAA
jgi:hypothetical protein